MDQVSQVKTKFRMEQWKNRITECQTSGMTVRIWCKQNGLAEQTYYKYLKRFRQELCGSLPVPIEEPEKPVAFKKLEVLTPLPNTKAAVIIRLPQATLEINEGASQQTIQAVLLALQSICWVISLLLKTFISLVDTRTCVSPSMA